MASESSAPAPAAAFEPDPETYEALVDWPKRLAHETPFYQRQFQHVGARRVLDAACGTGRHALLFRSWGLEVEGADLDSRMVEYCRARYGDRAGLSWVQRSFAEPCPAAGGFDAAICVGNSLALAPDRATAARAVGNLVTAVRPGGVCIVQVLNLWRLPEGPTAWQKCVLLPKPANQRILLKGVHRVGDYGFIDLLDLSLMGGELHSRTHAARFLGLREGELRAAATATGGTEVQCFGSFQETPYEATSSVDLILVCRRGPP